MGNFTGNQWRDANAARSLWQFNCEGRKFGKIWKDWKITGKTQLATDNIIAMGFFLRSCWDLKECVVLSQRTTSPRWLWGSPAPVLLPPPVHKHTAAGPECRCSSVSLCVCVCQRGDPHLSGILAPAFLTAEILSSIQVSSWIHLLLHFILSFADGNLSSKTATRA